MADPVTVLRSVSRDAFLNQIRCGVFVVMRELMSIGTFRRYDPRGLRGW